MFLELNKVFPELRNASPEARLLSEVSSNKELFLDDQPEELLGHRCELVQTRSIQCKTRHPNHSHSQTWGPFPHPCCWIKSYQIVEFFSLDPKPNRSWIGQLTESSRSQQVVWKQANFKQTESTETVTQKRLYTEKILHRAALKHKRQVYIQKLFTHRSSDIDMCLHQRAFTQSSF